MIPRNPPTTDAYAELLVRTRELRVEQRGQREQWLSSLNVDGKEELLFELEVLLKSAACFANPRNHPGRPKRAPVVAQNFREATLAFRDGMQRATALIRQLLGPRDRALVFQRYLETVLPGDVDRARLARLDADRVGPEESLISLRQGLASHVEVLDGVARAPRVPFRLFYALLSGVQREVAHSTYFNPLNALEFRPEFDRISSPQVLELIRSVPGEEPHRLVALTFLSLFRMLRYLRLLTRVVAESGGRRRRQGGRVYLILAVLRSDARALGDYLRQNAGPLLGRGFERDVMRIPAAELTTRSAVVRATAHKLIGIRAALEGVAASLRLEMRREFHHELPPLEGPAEDAELRTAITQLVGTLRPALRNAILFVGKSLGASLEEGVLDDFNARKESSERLRRDVWMFAHVVRAFATKAEHTDSKDVWAAVQGFGYVREFLSYFRAMGYPLLRSSEYPRFDAFMAAMARLEDTDLVDPLRLEQAIDECVAFHGYLQGLFDDISKRDVLNGVPFDRRAAATALRLYLGDRGAQPE